MLINQTLMCIKDEFLRHRYFEYIKDNKIKIVSDIFERMELDRKFADEKKRLMEQDGVAGLAAFMKKKKEMLR